MELSSAVVKVPDCGRFEIPLAKNIAALLPGQKLILLEKGGDEQKHAEPSAKAKDKPSKRAKTS
jgi:hypothetical protein